MVSCHVVYTSLVQMAVIRCMQGMLPREVKKEEEDSFRMVRQP